MQSNAVFSRRYHGHAYAANNPTTWTDPSGQFVGLMSLVLTAMFAHAAAFNLSVLVVMAERGMLTACAQDLECGTATATAALRLSVLYDPTVGPLVWAIFRAFPIALFSYVWAVTTPVILAVLECYESGRCVAETEAEDCIEWERNPANHGPYKHLGTIGKPGRPFSQRQRSQIITENRRENSGILRSDWSGARLVEPGNRGQAGYKVKENEAEIDHICPRSPKWQGSNAYSNACVLSNVENNAIKKRRQPQFPPEACVPGPGVWYGD